MNDEQTMEDVPIVPLELRAAGEAFSSWDGFLAFGFGSGLISRAPGTIGTLMAVPLAMLMKAAGPAGFWLLLLLGFWVGVWACERVSNRLGVEDYGGIVWDEMIGYWLTIAFFPPHWYWLLAGFLLFRFFDILKPWPISLVDEQIGGGLGIMLDDVLAAVYSIILMAGLNTVIPGQ